MADEERTTGARLLGYAGLIPFALFAVLPWALHPRTGSDQVGLPAFAALALLGGYGAAILSFLGGIRWGIEVGRAEAPRSTVLALSVLPSLAAWLLQASLLWPGPVWAFSGLLAAFTAQGGWDVRSPSLPAWFRRLRLHLTIGAILALSSGLLFSLLKVAYAVR